MFQRLLFSLLSASCLFASASAASAQATPMREPPPRNWELYGGYSEVIRPYDHTSTNPFTGAMNGWDASLRVPVPILGNWLGVKGDVSGSYRNDGPNFNPHSYFFLAGPQVSLHIHKSTLFAHAMVGSSHLNQNVIPSLKSGNTFAMAVGAGLDIGITRTWAWRVSGDFYNTNFQSSNVNVHDIVNSNGRLTTGPVLRF